jgi:tetratricopeptide (TPR) repeat protein
VVAGPLPDVSTLRQRAQRALDNGDLAPAVDAIDEALEQNPRDARSLALRGLIQQARARRENPPDLWLLESAETDLLRAIQVDPKDADVRHALGQFYLADGHQEAALKVFEEVLAIDGFHRRTLETCSRVRYERGEERMALDLLINLHRVWPQAEAMTWYRRAQCHLRVALSLDAQAARQRSDELGYALRAFREYRQLSPEDSDGLLGEAFTRARLLAERKPPPPDELEAIVALYVEAQGRRPRVAEPSFQAGVLLEDHGQPSRAQDFYAKALAADPDHVPSLLNLARLLAPHADTREAARGFFQRALPRLDDGPEKKAVEAWLAEPPASRKSGG